MKKAILLTALSAFAIGASAQYSCDPTTEALLKKGTPAKMWYITLSDVSVNTLTEAGTEMVYIGPDSEAGRNFWYWAGWVAGPETLPRVGMEDGGYMSLTVTGDAGWSGGGIAVNGPKTETKGDGIDLTGINDDTRFHFAYCTNTTAPVSVALILLDDGANGSQPAKMSIGKTAFDDNGTTFPRVGGEITDEWQGVDISFADLKKLWPSFAPANLKQWGGNVLSMLSGNVAQTNFCLDTIYIYNMEGTGGVEGVDTDSPIVITERTINAGNDGIEVYDAQGRRVASTDGCVLGIEELPAGLYIVKAGNAVSKFMK